MVNPKNNFTKDARVTGRFADVYVFFTRDTQHDAREIRSRRKKSRAALAKKLANIDQLSEAKKYLCTPDL